MSRSETDTVNETSCCLVMTSCWTASQSSTVCRINVSKCCDSEVLYKSILTIRNIESISIYWYTEWMGGWMGWRNQVKGQEMLCQAVVTHLTTLRSLAVSTAFIALAIHRSCRWESIFFFLITDRGCSLDTWEASCSLYVSKDNCIGWRINLTQKGMSF